uniref:Uncharacterized protein n=1 Tax=Rhizophagus irregularis (strain DAOM 181602 / DAOM 197198 / MUCL 43194) TaxID=747089 RepID=U9T5G9_RHIID
MFYSTICNIKNQRHGKLFLDIEQFRIRKHDENYLSHDENYSLHAIMQHGEKSSCTMMIFHQPFRAYGGP